MVALSSNLRRQLERTVVEARAVAEVGARAALEAHAVDHDQPFSHMAPMQRALRRRLRAHARQLGDETLPSGAHGIERLVHECAYEHWHAMLFARFLAENELLIEPETGMPVTMDECEDLAEEEGTDKWTLASRYAQRMLPQVFRPDHPAFEVVLAREHRLKLESLVESMPRDVFSASDALGWVYQFWQTKNKDEVNRSEVKIGADELPAVTQLFTEPYMVQFLLDNTLGAWWAGRTASLSGDSEDELRELVSIGRLPLSYLRFVRSDDREGEPTWRPAAGTFDRWPEHLGELKVMDPCCGSGHFLVAAFHMLVPMRMEVEGIDAKKAVDAVLRDNLHGLELDPRCVELAAFALALAAWTWPEAAGVRPLPELNLACSGLAPNATQEEWTALAEHAAAAGGMPVERDLFGVDDTLLSVSLRNSMIALHELFGQAPTLGSLIDPNTVKAYLWQSDFQSARGSFAAVLEREHTNDVQTERAVAARGMARAAELLSGRYHLVATNVPYLARGRQGDALRRFAQDHYPGAKNDLATVFLERCLELCVEGGTASLVLPQNWLFLTSYRKLREKLLKEETWHLLARLGPCAFATISGEVVKAILLTLSRSSPGPVQEGTCAAMPKNSLMYGLDVSESRTAADKDAALPSADIQGVEQFSQLGRPDAIVSLGPDRSSSRMSEFAQCLQGTSTGDNPRFVLKFWECATLARFAYFQTPSSSTVAFGGRECVVDWPGVSHFAHTAIRGEQAWGRNGVALGQMQSLPATMFAGTYFSNSTPVVTTSNPADLAALWCYCSSPQFALALRSINQKLSIDNGYMSKMPIDMHHWRNESSNRFPNGLPQPHTDDPTQWIFHGHPCGSVVWDGNAKRTSHGLLRTDSNVLQVAVARLLGFRWPAEQDVDMELAPEQREWVGRCDALHEFADTDGIVCLPAVRGEPPAAGRLLRLLAAAFGNTWTGGMVAELLRETGAVGFDDWLRDRFFQAHCKLFHHRPFVWHVWDGRRDGFHVLVNYHKLVEGGGGGRRLLESLTYSYLGDWISRQQDGIRRGEGGAEGRLAAAQGLQQRLEAILEGEPPFDIFVRWKPVGEQPVGWEPDIDDGVRLNIRPFMAEDIPGGKKGGGILRDRPNIHWRKDRGREPFRDSESFPWFWRDGEFTGARVNDVHLASVVKREARSRTEDEGAGTKDGVPDHALAASGPEQGP